jgi:hypothetical protein
VRALTGPATAPLGSTVTLTLSVPAVALQPSVSAMLPALSGIEVSGTTLVSGATAPGGRISFAGESGPQAAALATIPAITATAQLTLDKVGTAAVQTLGEFDLTPVDGATGNPLPPIRCVPPAVTLTLPITVTGPAPTPTPTPTPPPASGPVYTCTVAGSGTQDFAFPISATATGPGRVGTTDLVTLSIQSPTIVGNVRAKAASQAEPTVDLKASLPVTGVQTGSIRVFGGNSVNASTIKATGKLALTKAGTDKILLPPTFQVIGVAPGLNITLLSCTLKTTPDAVLLTLKVAGAAAHPVPEATGATPIGAPNTGGGGSLRAAFSVPQAAGGAAILLAGAGLALGAIRRRKKGPRTAA